MRRLRQYRSFVWSFEAPEKASRRTLPSSAFAFEGAYPLTKKP
jgi:hypothetical protein